MIVFTLLYYFDRAAKIKCLELGALNNRNLFSYDSGVKKSESKVLAGNVDITMVSRSLIHCMEED